MPLLDGDLAGLFGSAFSVFYLDATLHKVTSTDDGSGGYAVATVDYPIKAMIEAMSDKARAASGLPLTAVDMSLLRRGMSIAVALDDLVTVSGQTYRIIRVETDPAGAAWSVAAVAA